MVWRTRDVSTRQSSTSDNRMKAGLGSKYSTLRKPRHFSFAQTGRVHLAIRRRHLHNRTPGAAGLHRYPLGHTVAGAAVASGSSEYTFQNPLWNLENYPIAMV